MGMDVAGNGTAKVNREAGKYRHTVCLIWSELRPYLRRYLVICETEKIVPLSARLGGTKGKWGPAQHI